MIQIDAHSYILEQGPSNGGNGEQQVAWDALILAGHDPRAYMYMNSSISTGMGRHESHAFKHRITRKYVYTRGNLRLEPRVLGSSQ